MKNRIKEIKKKTVEVNYGLNWRLLKNDNEYVKIKKKTLLQNQKM